MGKVEHITEDFKHVCKMNGISNLSIAHANKSKSKKILDIYTSETEALVRKIYSEDFEYFGYEK